MTTCTYDERGNVIVLEHLDNAIPEESRTTYSYDELGNRTRSAYDANRDGEPEQVCTYDPPCPPPFEDCWETESCERVSP